jgi:hypothetical protein
MRRQSAFSLPVSFSHLPEAPALDSGDAPAPDGTLLVPMLVPGTGVPEPTGLEPLLAPVDDPVPGAVLGEAGALRVLAPLEELCADAVPGRPRAIATAAAMALAFMACS